MARPNNQRRGRRLHADQPRHAVTAAAAATTPIPREQKRELAIITSGRAVANHREHDRYAEHTGKYISWVSFLVVDVGDSGGAGATGAEYIHVPRSAYKSTAAWGAAIEQQLARYGVKYAAFCQCRWRFQPVAYVHKIFDEMFGDVDADWNDRYSPIKYVRSWLKRDSPHLVATVFSHGPGRRLYRSDVVYRKYNNQRENIIDRISWLGFGAVTEICNLGQNKTIVTDTGRVLSKATVGHVDRQRKLFYEKYGGRDDASR